MDTPKIPTFKFPRAGYRVHFDRLRDIRTEASFIRTHKFKCEIPKVAEQELKEKFERVAKVVDSSEEGSGMWFIVQLAGMGFLLPTAGNKLLLYQERFGMPSDLGFPVPNQIALSKTLQTGADSIRAIQNSLVNIWNVEKEEKLPEQARNILRKIEEQGNGRAFGGRATGLNQWVKNIFAEELQCEKLKDIKKGEDNLIYNVKFLEWNEKEIQQWITQEKIPEFTLSDQSFPWLFKNILPATQLLGEDPENLLSPYHVLKTFIEEWKQNTESLSKLLNEQISDSFDQKREFIALLVNHVSECARQVPSALQDDFIAQDWAEYRETNFSGRISGWLSNFMNRLKEFSDALSSSVHPKELVEWKVPENVSDFLLEERNGLFYFKDLKNVEKEQFSYVDQKTGEEKEKTLEEFIFWGKDKKKKGALRERFENVKNCTTTRLRIIKENCYFDAIFPKDFRDNFQELEKLQQPLLAKLRSVTLSISDESANSGDMSTMIDEYRQFLQPVNEFLMKWNNEGIPSNSEDKEIMLWDKKGEKNGLWLSIDLLEKSKKDKKSTQEESEKVETNKKILGYFKKNLVPQDLPRYPRFLYEGQKPMKREIEIAEKANISGNEGSRSIGIKLYAAKKIVQDTTKVAEIFCRAIETQKDTEWEQHDWHVTKKMRKNEWKTVRHLGQLHKSFEALRGIAQRAKNPGKIIEFLNEYVLDSKESPEWQKYLDFLNQQGYEKKENFEEGFKFGEKVTQKNIPHICFYLSGKEKRKDWQLIAVKMISYEEFLKQFAEKFGLEEIDPKKENLFDEFLEIQDGTSDNSVTQAELLKFWWARRFAPLKQQVELTTDFSNDKTFTENVLSRLLFENNLQRTLISRSEATRFLQAGLGADLRAKIGLLSRKEFVIRNVIQAGDGKNYQSFLQYEPLPWTQGNVNRNETEIEQKIEEIDAMDRKDPMKRKRLKRQLRRLKLAKRSPLQKFKKNLYHMERDIENFQKHGAAPNIIQDLKRRKELLETKIKHLETHEYFGFSAEAQKKLAKIFPEGNIPSSNEEIARKICEQKHSREFVPILGEIPHRWRIVLRTSQEISTLQSLRVQQGFRTSDQNIFAFKPEKGKYFYSLPIQTSAVQKQFLEYLLWGDKENILTEATMGSSLILQRDTEIHWQKDKLDLPESFQLFCAIPFQFSKKGEKVEDKIYRQSIKDDMSKNGEKILGIDLGEYGFGWAVWNPEKEIFEASGFQEIPLLKKMRDSATDWKETQSQGIFSRPTTYLAELREQAAGQTRNQIHRLALQYHAKPVYEDSVDGFESGSKKIEKLYKTLKTADIIGGNSNEADKTVRKHFWGIPFAQMGGVIGAAKTSQTCRKCGRCATSEIEDFIQQASGNEKITLSEKRERVKEEQRQENPQKPERGKDALFVCQLCKNLTDADEQAAKNIALKYYFKASPKFAKEREEKIEIEEKGKKQQQKKFYDEKTGQFSSLKFFLEKSPMYTEL